MTTTEILGDRPSRVATMTGLTSDQVDRLVLDVYAAGVLDPARRRAVGPYRAVLAVLLYLRHNTSQALIGELFGCSQSTVSRLVGRLLPIKALRRISLSPDTIGKIVGAALVLLQSNTIAPRDHSQQRTVTGNGSLVVGIVSQRGRTAAVERTSRRSAG